jgi:hypothetical protein
VNLSLSRIQPLVAVLIAAHLSVVPGFPATGMPVIGFVEARTAFRLDHATVSGNATLFEGAIIETGLGQSAQQLRNGARVTLLAESAGRFYDDHMVLERGQGRLDHATRYFFEARGLTVQPENGASTGGVALQAGAGVQVTALTGSLRVLNAQRMMVAKVLPGAPLAFSPQAASEAGVTRVSGRLVNQGGHYLLTDETTNVTVELTGPGLKKEEGRRVEIAGSRDPAATPVSGATQVIRVTGITRLPAGTAAAATGGTATGASGAAITGTTLAVIGGVAAAAAVGGLAAAGTLSGGSAAVSR